MKLVMDDSLKSVAPIPGLNRSAIDNLVGTTVDGRYLIERELGHGGVGAVYLALDHKLLDKPVVVKVLLEKSLRDAWVVQKFQQEKEALARVDHPGVVGILDTGELPNGEPYIVMQYIEGIALRDAIRAKPEGMDLERVASIIKQIGAALCAVHEAKIYHRDLKPENIMLQALGRGDQQVKVVDFGIAKITESVIAPSTITGTATAGTIVYMSPEQLRGARVSAASDIYSLGVIAYEMVTGRRPFNPDTTAHLAEMQREGIRAKPADLRPRLPEGAERIILKALAFDPTSRYQNAGEFGDALSLALMNEDETLKLRRKSPDVIGPTELSVERASPDPQSVERSERTLVTPFEPASVRTYNQPIPSPVEPEIHRGWWPKLVIASALTLALAVGAYVLIGKRQFLFGTAANANPGNPVVQRSLVYSLTVQKFHNGASYDQPFETSGQEIFENGWKFKMNISSPQDGYVYLLNEGPAASGAITYNMLFPEPKTNRGSAKVAANDRLQTAWMRFDEHQGIEKFWIVWSASSVKELEDVTGAVNPIEKGEIKEADQAKGVRNFLEKHSSPKPEVAKDSAGEKTTVKGTGNLLVSNVELKHH